MTTAEMLRVEGRVEGKALGKAEDILVVFEQRGIGVDDKSRELIESCTDLATRNRPAPFDQTIVVSDHRHRRSRAGATRALGRHAGVLWQGRRARRART